ncbi:glycosyl transferase family 90-domain-containing protein [Roridomyces roridus]|uniref:Glycosyl transferase family 90-domain-containing protein n=1 Tax=Roridomyces roridus TaxID=1738132 RepID=A0AAD7FDI1_9AGAR|nr:glycosyl transferase family 90-domain-containing protein [Roridomyces roridus]
MSSFMISRRRCTTITAVIASLVVVAVVYGTHAPILDAPLPPHSDPPPPEPPSQPDDPSLLTAVDQLFRRQSTTLEEAVARYTLRNGRSPPPSYDRWFQFAREGKCLIDDYDQLYDDFEPFHQLAKLDSSYFKRMVEKGIQIGTGKEYLGIRTFKMRNHQFEQTDPWPEDPGYVADWMATIRSISDWLPDMDLPISMRDECRVQVNVHDGRAAKDMLKPQDKLPFTNRPHPTYTYYAEEGHCLYPNQAKGFVDYANNYTAFLLYSTSQEFTTDLYPLLSQGKIHPCFSDISFPSTYYYKRSRSSPKFGRPDDVSWEDKKPVLYWRGSVAGGMIHGENYRAFPRFRLIDLSRAHPGTMNVALTRWNTWCDGDCDQGAIEREYEFDLAGSPQEELYKYKYAMDLDGHGWSGRFHGLLASGSLVFKSTVFTEYFSQWLRPYEHYIPVRPDLTDLPDKLEWARTHDEEARRIQQAGKEFVERVITDRQNDCYFGLVLLEWAGLQGMSGKKGWW